MLESFDRVATHVSTSRQNETNLPHHQRSPPRGLITAKKISSNYPSKADEKRSKLHHDYLVMSLFFDSGREPLAPGAGSRSATRL